jgi:hypothetical protein
MQNKGYGSVSDLFRSPTVLWSLTSRTLGIYCTLQQNKLTAGFREKGRGMAHILGWAPTEVTLRMI